MAGGGGAATRLKVPGQGLLGLGQVSNQIKYWVPAVMLTVILFEVVDEPTEFTHVPPEVGQPA